MPLKIATPRTVKWIRWGIVSMVVVAVSALAVGSMGPKKSNVTFGSTSSNTRSVAGGDTTLGPAYAGPVEGVVPAPAAPVTNGAPATDTASLPNLPDRIARTSDLTVEVKKGSFDARWKSAFEIAQQFGGQIMSSTRGVPSPQPMPLEQNGTTSSAKQPAIGDITIRIPAKNFVNASIALRGLGIVRGDTTTTEDVGQEYVDLQSRLRNLRAEQNVLLALFNRAKTIKDTLAVQGQLTNVEGQIEQITGRINYLDARTLFSTITVHLQEPGVTVISTVPENPSLGGAWDTAKAGLVRLAGAALISALWALPFAVLGLIGLAIWRRARGPAPQV